MGRLTFVLILVGSFLAMPEAFAGTDLNKCKQSSQTHANNCMQAKNSAEAANTSAAQAAGNAATTNINKNSGASKGVNQNAANNLNNAKDQCQKEKDQCDKDCKDAKASADQKVQAGMSQNPPCSQSPCPEAKADQPQIQPEQEKSCDGAILPIMADLGKGAGDAQNAANGDGNTQGASGMPPIPPIPPPSPKPDQTATSSSTSPTLTPTTTACSPSDPTTATNASCTDTMVKTCTPGLSSANQTVAGCDTFTANYCQAVTGTTQFPTAVPMTPAGTTRAGSGVGTTYCTNATAQNFCTDPKRFNCATCQASRGMTVDPTLAATCPVVEPPTTSNPVTTVGSTGGGSTGGSGSAGGNGDINAPAPAVATKEGAVKTSASAGLNMAVSEGGGSGGGSGSALDDYFSSKYGSLSGPAVTKKAAVATRSPASADVATQSSPSLFNISSAAIQSMCAANRLRHCGRN